MSTILYALLQPLLGNDTAGYWSSIFVIGPTD